MSQLPAPRIVRVDPEIEQIEVLDESYEIVNELSEVAARVIAESPKVALAREPKVMVWFFFRTAADAAVNAVKLLVVPPIMFDARSASRRFVPTSALVGVNDALVAPEIAAQSDGATSAKSPTLERAFPLEIHEYHWYEMVTVPAPTQTPGVDS
jgi:hypothetical protein